MTRVVLSIGANLGDSRGTIVSVLDALTPWVRAQSSLWASRPWGGVEQPDFLNVTAVLDRAGWDAWQWLRWGQERETAARRVRDQRWGPRTLDIDVVAAGTYPEYGWTSTDPQLMVPHPHAAARAFVLLPWAEVEPEAQLGGHSLRRLCAGLSETERSGVQIAEDSWAPRLCPAGERA